MHRPSKKNQKFLTHTTYSSHRRHFINKKGKLILHYANIAWVPITRSPFNQREKNYIISQTHPIILYFRHKSQSEKGRQRSSFPVLLNVDISKFGRNLYSHLSIASQHLFSPPFNHQVCGYTPANKTWNVSIQTVSRSQNHTTLSQLTRSFKENIA